MKAQNVLVVGLLALIGFFGYIALDEKDVQVVVEKTTETLAAVSGPDISSPYLTVNGVEMQYRSQKFTTGTSTVCALQAPTTGTSTLIEGNVKAATSTDYILTIAKSATQNGTTTLIRAETVTTDGQVALPTSSTTVSAVADTNRTFAPGQWLNVGVAGLTNPATSLMAGSCAAVFMVGGGT